MAIFTVEKAVNLEYGGFSLIIEAGGSGSCPDDLFAELKETIEGGHNTVTLLASDRLAHGFNVQDYGAMGNGTDDDHAGFQAAAKAAIAVGGCLIIPPPSVAYILSNTVSLYPASGTSFSLDIVAHMPNTKIIPTWSTDGKAMFHSLGWKRGVISGVAAVTSGSSGKHSNTVVWDIDADDDHTSSGNLTFIGCQVNFQGHGTDHIAWRMGHSGDNDVSFMKWDTCKATGASDFGTSGEIGWSFEGQNALEHSFLNVEGTRLKKFVTNVPSTGGPTLGGGSLTFFGGGTEYCNTVVEYARKWHPLTFFGGRHENGKTFLSVPNTADPTLAVPVALHGVLISGFRNDIQFDLKSAVSLLLDGVMTEDSGAGRGSAFDAGFVTINPGDSGALCYLSVRGGFHYGTWPIYTVTSGDLVNDMAGLVLIDDEMKASSRASA